MKKLLMALALLPLMAVAETWYDSTTGYTWTYGAYDSYEYPADGRPRPVVRAAAFASGYANVGGLKDGAIMADFAPIVTVNKVKRALSVYTNLWFDRTDGHEGGAGGANFAE